MNLFLQLFWYSKERPTGDSKLSRGLWEHGRGRPQGSSNIRGEFIVDCNLFLRCQVWALGWQWRKRWVLYCAVGVLDMLHCWGSLQDFQNFDTRSSKNFLFIFYHVLKSLPCITWSTLNSFLSWWFLWVWSKIKRIVCEYVHAILLPENCGRRPGPLSIVFTFLDWFLLLVVDPWWSASSSRWSDVPQERHGQEHVSDFIMSRYFKLCMVEV